HTFDALIVNQALCASEPAAPRPHLTGQYKLDSDPERAASSLERLSGLEVRLVGAFEDPNPFVVAAEHECRRGQQLEVWRLETNLLVGLGQARVGVEPRLLRVRLASLLEACHF